MIANEEITNETTTYVSEDVELEINVPHGGGTENKKDEKTGDTTKYVIWVVLLIVMVVAIIASVIIRKKKGIKIIPFMIIASLIAASNINVSYAEEASRSFISVTTDVKVNGSKVTFEVKVNYDKVAEEEGLEKPANPTEEDDYYWATSKVISVIDVNESEDVLTETEVIRLLEERGFIDYPVTYDFSMDGEYLDTLEAKDGSDEKHPMYETYFMCDNGDIWSIYVINGSIFACPLSFVFESDIEAEVLYLESNKLTSYGCDGNKFYVTIPYGSAVIVKQIDRIDANSLNNIVYEEILSDEE